MVVTFEQNSHYMWFVSWIFHAKLFFLKAHISLNLFPSVSPLSNNYGPQMEYVSHYTQSQEAKKQVGVGKHETIHNTREKWRRPFLVLLLLHSPLYPSLLHSFSFCHLAYRALAIALFPVDRKQIEGNAAI